MSQAGKDLFQEAFSLHESGRFTAAQEKYEQVLANEPDHSETLHLLGVLHHQRGDNVRGAELIEHALAIQPQNPAFRYNLGVIYQELGREDEAEASYREVIANDPQAVSAWVNLGNLLLGRGRFSEAADCHRNSLALQPNEAEHHVRLGNSLKMQGFVETALSHYGNAVAVNPHHAAAHSALLFASQYEPGIDLRELSRRHREWWDQHGKPLRPENETEKTGERLVSLRNSGKEETSETLRIGFVSPDLGNHPVGIFLAPLLERLKAMDGIETFCFSDSGKSDEFTNRNRQASDHWENIKGIDDETVAKQILGERIEILFDLTGHTDDNRLPLFSRKPAPIQITWAGYVGSTGLKTMDYILTDPFHTPETFDEFYSETPIRLARDYIPYEPPAYAPEVGPLPMLESGVPTFGCLNNPTKISFPAIQIWSEILREAPEARLILKYKGMDDRAVKLRIHGLFASQGITPDRVELIGQTQHRAHLEVFGRIDVALDPFPYSSGLSACESLWMGVPVVTCPGDTFASRHSLSHLSNSGISGTIAQDWSEYVDIALNLVRNPDELKKVRESMRDQVAASPLCDLDGYAEDFAKAMREVQDMNRNPI